MPSGVSPCLLAGLTGPVQCSNARETCIVYILLVLSIELNMCQETNLLIGFRSRNMILAFGVKALMTSASVKGMYCFNCLVFDQSMVRWLSHNELVDPSPDNNNNWNIC